MFRPVKSIWPAVARSVTRNIKPRSNMSPMSHIQPRLTVNLRSVPLRSLNTATQNDTTTTSDKDINTTSPLNDQDLAQITTEPDQVEEEPDTVLGETIQEKEALWKAYLDRIAKKDPNLTAQDFLDIAKVISLNKYIDQKKVISRLQLILRDIHERQTDDPELSKVFVRTCNMLMKSFNAIGDLGSTMSVFEGLVATGNQVTDVTLSTVLYGLSRHGKKTDVYEFVKSLQERDLFIESPYVYYRIIGALKHHRDLRGCRYFYGIMKEKGIQPEQNCYHLMMEVYKLSGQPGMVLDMFNEIKSQGITPSPEMYTFVLGQVKKNSTNPQLAQDIFEEAMASGGKFNVSIYLVMGYDPMEALLEMKKNGVEFELRDFNHCLSRYVKKNEFVKALELFKIMNESEIEADQYSYAILFDALSKDKETPLELIFDVYEGMKEQGISPDVVTYSSLITACGRSNDMERALDLLEEMQTYNVAPNLHTFNALLSVISRSTNLKHSDLDKATSIWSKMTSMNITPDTRAFNKYLLVICKLIKPVSYNDDLPSESIWEEQKIPYTVRELLRMYRHMKSTNNPKTQPDFLTYSMVINALCTAGQVRSVMQVYDDAKLSRVVLHVATYNEVMSFLQRSGKVSESMNVWHDMRSQGVSPNHQTYEIVLEGCEQLGLQESIKSIRNQRKQDFHRLDFISNK